MSDNQLIYYSKRHVNFASNVIKKKYINLVRKICWKYYLKYQYVFTNIELVIQEAQYIFLKSQKNFKEIKKIDFKFFLCLQLKYFFIGQIRNHMNNKNKSLTTAYFYQKIDNFNNYLKDQQEDIGKVAIQEIVYNRVLQKLQKTKKLIIKLWSEGYTYKEISKIQNLSIKKIDNMIQGIIKKEKQAFGLNKLN